MTLVDTVRECVCVCVCICQGLSVRMRALAVSLHAYTQVGRWSSSARTATAALILREENRPPSYPDKRSAHLWVLFFGFFLQVQCLLAFEIIKG